MRFEFSIVCFVNSARKNSLTASLLFKIYKQLLYRRYRVLFAVLKIRERDDPRTGQKGWSFVERSYNFDSAAGIRYTVDVTKPKGERVAIESFDLSKEYNVAMTSYRASGGGGLLREAGVDTDRIDERIVSRYPEIREILYEYLKANGGIDPAVTGNPDVIGAWKFVPEKVAGPAIERDLELMFSR